MCSDSKPRESAELSAPTTCELHSLTSLYNLPVEELPGNVLQRCECNTWPLIEIICLGLASDSELFECEIGRMHGLKVFKSAAMVSHSFNFHTVYRSPSHKLCFTLITFFRKVTVTPQFVCSICLPSNTTFLT
jgi:hypothetical protein